MATPSCRTFRPSGCAARYQKPSILPMKIAVTRGPSVDFLPRSDVVFASGFPKAPKYDRVAHAVAASVPVVQLRNLEAANSSVDDGLVVPRTHGRRQWFAALAMIRRIRGSVRMASTERGNRFLSLDPLLLVSLDDGRRTSGISMPISTSLTATAQAADITPAIF